MRRVLASTLMIVSIVLAIVITMFAAGCGTATNAASQAAPAPTTAEGILAKVMASSQSLTSGTGEFNLSVTVDGDTSKMPATDAALLGQPIAVSGTFAFNEDPPAVDASLNASLAGQSLNVGIKAADKKAWIQFMGQWYEVPVDAMQEPGATGTTLSQANKAALMQAIQAAGIDPATWLSGLKIVGNDTIDGTATYHLQGAVDINKVMTDVMKLTQDKTIMGMIGQMASGMMGSADTGMTGTASSSLPSAEELQTVQSELAAIFKNLTVDVWITHDSYQMRQMQLDATMVPPAGEDPQGVNSITLKLSVSMAPASAPLTVTPPADAKPFTELEKALGALQGMFSGTIGDAESTTTTTGQ